MMLRFPKFVTQVPLVLRGRALVKSLSTNPSHQSEGVSLQKAFLRSVKPNIENSVKPDFAPKIVPVESKTESAVTTVPISVKDILKEDVKSEKKWEKMEASTPKPQQKPSSASFIFKDIAPPNVRPIDSVSRQNVMPFTQGHLQEFAPKILVNDTIFHTS